MAHLEVNSLSHIYFAGTPLARKALKNVSFTLAPGEALGLVGKTGSGKTTLLSHLNGLLKPTNGGILLDGVPYFSKKIKMDMVCQKIGLLFQFPEWQLFEATVYQDVAFGPLQIGVTVYEIEQRVMEALKMVGLEPDIYMQRDPLLLSGGEMRRVALAGILAMRPEILVLDEPTIGLDAESRSHLVSLLSELRKTQKISLVIASHNLEELFILVDRVIVLNNGEVAFNGLVRELLDWDENRLRSCGLVLPEFSRLLRKLKLYFQDITTNCVNMQETKNEILRALEAHGV